jgi:hypothetical protein
MVLSALWKLPRMWQSWQLWKSFPAKALFCHSRKVACSMLCANGLKTGLVSASSRMGNGCSVAPMLGKLIVWQVPQRRESLMNGFSFGVIPSAFCIGSSSKPCFGPNGPLSSLAGPVSKRPVLL